MAMLGEIQANGKLSVVATSLENVKKMKQDIDNRGKPWEDSLLNFMCWL